VIELLIEGEIKREREWFMNRFIKLNFTGKISIELDEGFEKGSRERERERDTSDLWEWLRENNRGLFFENILKNQIKSPFVSSEFL